MKLHFHGAARQVTGSKHVLEVGGRRILLDCGLVQGEREAARAANANLPFDAEGIDVCVISHAHVDHSGNLPTLVKAGYAGPIYCTPATADLAEILLRDSAMLQERDAEYANKKRAETDQPPIEPLYTAEDVEPVLGRFERIPYHERREVAPGVHLTFYDAGHILGSAVTRYELEEEGRTVRLGFTGDLGRANQPILRDPEPLPPLDVLLTESTYGDRSHPAEQSMKEALRQVIDETIRRAKGRLIIPAFSVGRTQRLFYELSELWAAGALPKMKVYLDSPLAQKATGIYARHPECFDGDTLQRLQRGNFSGFADDYLVMTPTVQDSMGLNYVKKPCVVISASGMCEGGRIVHHLKHGLANPNNTVLIVGYQAEYTLGRQLVEGAEVVTIFGDPIPVKARIVVLNGFSAHADREELTRWIERIPELERAYVVHGEEHAATSFAAHLTERGLEASVPTSGDVVTL